MHCLYTLTQRGEYACVKALLEQGVSVPAGASVSGSLAVAAATSGNVQCLELVVSHGAPWTEQVCAAAVEKDRIACLKYAREQGCPWNESGSVTQLQVAVRSNASNTSANTAFA